MVASKFLFVEENGHVSPMDHPGVIQAGMAQLVGMCEHRTDAKGRTVWNVHERSMQIAERHFDHAMRDTRADVAAVRGDDFAATLGMFNPRDLTYKFRQALEERTPPRQSTEVFQINTEVTPGSLAYEQSRLYSTGEAVVYRGGTGADIPEVGLGQATFQHPVVTLISKASINWLESLRTNMVGFDTQARKLRAMRLVIEELEDRWTFIGSTEHNLYGLLNHPYVDTALSTVAYTSATSSDDIATDFGTWANYADNQSGSAFGPDTLLIAGKLENSLRNRKYSDNADKSLMQWMLDANPHIKRVVKCHRLNDAGGSGIHAMAFVRSGSGAADASAEIVKPMGMTMLPPEKKALATEIYTVSQFGGLNQREAGDNLVVYVSGPT